jgi:hypothetical protein
LKINDKKKIYRDYINRWQLVKTVEEEELRNSSFDLLFTQTLSIWDISNSLNFNNNTNTNDSTWSTLQKTWIRANA